MFINIFLYAYSKWSDSVEYHLEIQKHSVDRVVCNYDIMYIYEGIPFAIVTYVIQKCRLVIMRQ